MARLTIRGLTRTRRLGISRAQDAKHTESGSAPIQWNTSGGSSDV
jgi:hypothetical protein